MVYPWFSFWFVWDILISFVIPFGYTRLDHREDRTSWVC